MRVERSTPRIPEIEEVRNALVGLSEDFEWLLRQHPEHEGSSSEHRRYVTRDAIASLAELETRVTALEVLAK